MSRSYRAPFASVTRVRSAADDKRLAARGVRRKQNQWLRKTADFDEAIVPHRLECPWNEVYCWGRDGGQHFQVPDDRDWSRHCSSTERSSSIRIVSMERPQRMAAALVWAAAAQVKIWAVGLLGVVACFASRIVRWVQFPHGPPNFASRVCAVDTLR